MTLYIRDVRKAVSLNMTNETDFFTNVLYVTYTLCNMSKNNCHKTL